jgi:hypothetical protein
MKLHLHITRLSLLPAAAMLLLVPRAAISQTTVYPLPFVTTIAGLATGSGNTLCSGSIPNSGGQSLGDGCLPTQAQLLTLYDVEIDPAGNIYTSENGTNNDIRVIYKGGTAFANLLTSANPSVTSPIPGRIYTFAGGISAALTHTNNAYYCGNVVGGQQALDSIGDGCPAAQVYLKPRGFAIDSLGNVFTTTTGGGNYIRVIYAGGATVANLITLENPGVTPKVGYIYKLAGQSTGGYSGDGKLASGAAFVALRYIAVDSNDNLFISDGTTQTTVSSTVIEAAANNVREINATTGFISTVAGQNNCTYSATTGCPYGTSADGVPAAGALLSTPYDVFVDASNNLYIADYYNSKIRVVYLTAGSTIPGISNPGVGNIYTYAGGGTLTAPGTPANQVKFTNLYVAGIDHAGNIYAEDGTSKTIWKFDAKTGLGSVIAGGASSATAPQKGAACFTGSAITSTDSFGDGCPGTENQLSDTGLIAWDYAGNGYVAENGNGIVREMSYGNQFAASASAESQPLAFEIPTTALPVTSSFAIQGTATAEYTGTTPLCTTFGAATGYQLCTLNTTFTPARAGLRAGSITLSSATVPAATVTELLGGVGIAADSAVDTGTQTTLGTGLKPAGVATDLLGNVYVSDTTSNKVLKGAASGTTLTPLVSGLNNPTALALDSFGDLFIANTGANNVIEAGTSGAVIATLGSGLSSPQGAAVDGYGNIFIADTGNNRIVQIFPNGSQTTLGITGLSAPKQIATDASGNLYIVDSGNSRIVTYKSGTQSSLTLDAGVVPSGVAVDNAGDVYVADSAGLEVLLYSVGVSTGEVLLSNLGAPVALASNPDASLFLADSKNTGAIELNRSLGNILFPLTNVGQTTTASITVSSVGNTALNFPASPLTTQTGSGLYTVASSSSNGCGLGINYNPGSDCNFTASFTPQITGPSSANVYFSTNATNAATANALLSGQGLLLTKTSTSLNITSPAAGPYYYSQSFVFTASVTPVTVTTTPTGTFTFNVDGKSQTPQPYGTGTVTLNLSPLSGNHTVTVTYSGDGTYASSANTVQFTVNPAMTTTVLTEAPVNNNGALSLLFTATVSSTTAKVTTGSVSFYAGTQLLGTQNVNASGVATLSTSALTFATNSFTAVYSDTTDTNYAGSASVAVVPVADFTLGIPSTALSISQGGVATVTFNVAPLFNGAGSITPSCTGLPANSVCRFQPVVMTLGATAQQESVLIYTNVASNLARNERPGDTSQIFVALCFAGGLGLLTLRRRSALRLFGVAVCCVALLGGLSGCNAGNSTQATTPPGTYAITIVFTGSNGLTTTHSANVSLTVVQDAGPF